MIDVYNDIYHHHLTNIRLTRLDVLDRTVGVQHIDNLACLGRTALRGIAIGHSLAANGHENVVLFDHVSTQPDTPPTNNNINSKEKKLTLTIFLITFLTSAISLL